MERVTAPIELKEAKADGSFTGYAAVFNNVDLGQDVILPGAFDQVRTTRDGKVRIALYHTCTGWLAKPASSKTPTVCA